MYKCRGSGNHLMTMVVFRDNLALMVVNDVADAIILIYQLNGTFLNGFKLICGHIC